MDEIERESIVKQIIEYYNKLIGNISLLTSYNTDIKPEYTLYIPLNFWFCKYEALSLPLISLQYTDIIFHVQFKKFSECAYSSLKYEHSDDPIENEKKTNLLDNILISQNKDLEASLLIEYVYLDVRLSVFLFHQFSSFLFPFILNLCFV